MCSVTPVTSFIHKTSHRKSSKSPRRSKWASMHIHIAWQIYYTEQRKKTELKSKSLHNAFETKNPPIQYNADTVCAESVSMNSPYFHSMSLYHHTIESEWDKLPPDQLCEGKGIYKQYKKLVCNFKDCSSYIWKPQGRKRYSEYPKFHPSVCKEKRQKQEVQDYFWSHTTSYKTPAVCSCSGSWNNNLHLIYSPGANPVYLHQVASVDTCLKLEGFSRSSFYSLFLKYKSFMQEMEQNYNVKHLWMPAYSLWSYDNCLLGASQSGVQGPLGGLRGHLGGPPKVAQASIPYK